VKPILRRVLSVGGPVIGLVISIALFGALQPGRFFSFYNFKNVVTQSVIVAVGAIGMSFVIAIGGIDLSIGSVVALVSVVSAILLREGYGPWLALGGGVLVGLLAGALNGVVITRAKVLPFIMTLGAMGIWRGVAKYLANEQMVHAPESWLAELMTKTPTPEWLLVSRGAWITLILAGLATFLMRRTVFGVHVLAIGSNEATARLCGVRVERTKLMVYALAGAFAGLAGVFQFARLTEGDPTGSAGLELHVIAAVVLGGGSLSGGRASVAGSLLGAFFMAVLANGCTLTDVPTFVQEIIINAIIVLAAGLDRLRA
jgi:ribose transport system permease protein